MSTALHPAWLGQAGCRGCDPDLWFPQQGGDVAEARRICGSCPVRERCLEMAIDEKIVHGIFGGHTTRERRLIARGLPPDAHARRKPIEHGTHRGYNQHVRRGEQACEACRTAHSVYRQADRPSRSQLRVVR